MPAAILLNNRVDFNVDHQQFRVRNFARPNISLPALSYSLERLYVDARSS